MTDGVAVYVPPFIEYKAVVEAFGIDGKLEIITVTLPTNPPTAFIGTVTAFDCDQPAGRNAMLRF